MNTYQIGNKITCIIRAYSAGKIGDDIATYNNEPYTILRDVGASLTFTDRDKNARSGIYRELNYDVSTLNQVKINNVHLTERVLKLIFKKNEVALMSHYENVESDEEGRIYLSTPADTIYQVFIYDENTTLVYSF